MTGMNLRKQTMATLGLVLITILAAIQYVFLQNVPDTVSTFAFVCVTNVIGLVILGALQFRKLAAISRRTLLKGILFAAELIGFNSFLLLGSRHLDAVVISSVVSFYFVFITPILLLLHKKVNFFSSIATAIAIIALLLMFGADTETLFSSTDVVYLIIADLFFAAYVVSVSVFGEKEDASALTFTQMLFSALFALVGWFIESRISGAAMTLPTEMSFWVSALFFGVCIRAVYGLVQITCQKHVSALKASLIFSMEIIVTLVTNPFMCTLLHMEYKPVTFFQVMGAILLIVATVMVDDAVMVRLGYDDIKETSYVNEKGETVTKSSVSRKMILTTVSFALVTLILSTVTFLSAIYFIRDSSVNNSRQLGETASSISSEAMMAKLEDSILSQVTDKALLAEQKLSAYSDALVCAASYAEALYRMPEDYPDREVPEPVMENAGTWVMQRTLANPSVHYAPMISDSKLLGNMEDIFVPLVANHENIATVYLGTERGLMVSYDPNSDTAITTDGGYYEYRDSVWYLTAKRQKKCIFTETYQDRYGRGLTITCAAPIFSPEGYFMGCVGMDILMKELNDSMVNDGIVIPSLAALIDRNGNYIAGRDVDELSENMGSIFDTGRNEALRQAGREILARRKGVVSVGEGEEADYISFATIDSTDWTLCILTPVSSVIEPAVAIRKGIDENTRTVVATVTRVILAVIQTCLLLSALILVIVTLFTGKFSRRISDPLKQLEADVKTISGGKLDSRTTVTTNDEIGSLANSFNIMTDSLQKYIADLKKVTAKEQRIAGELSAATSIQASMLPRNFGAFSSGRPFDLFASMDPAKEVGGDFYDFFMIDENRLGLVMADVSGKGVPAALFMVIAKTLIKNRAQMGGGPAEILASVNDQLCQGNEEEMFVTVWFGILDLATGKGMAANAGHEHPVIRRAGGLYELVVYRHSPALATFEGLRFREHEFELHPGDSLFVYTDGVAEATNAREELFGTDRMLEALNRNPDGTPEEEIRTLKASIDAFVGEADQFDDITMLGLHYFGTEAQKHG